MSSLRSAIITAMKAESSISDIVSTRISHILYEFEDLLNEPANSSIFPAVHVKTIDEENENNLNGHDNLRNGSYEVLLYHQIQTANLRSRAASVKAAEEAKLDTLDSLKNAIETFLNNSRGAMGTFTIRDPHCRISGEQDFNTGKNRKLIQIPIIFTTMFS